MKKLIPALILALTFAIPCLAIAEDKADRLSQESSYTFSPGYINAAKYQAESVLKVNLPGYKEKGVFEKALDYVNDKLASKTDEHAPIGQIANPVLQMKTSQTNSSSNAPVQLLTPQGSVLVTDNYKVNAGTGQIQQYDGGRLISEYIDGVKHIYVGLNENTGYKFDGTTTPLQDAINSSKAGDVIIVGKGTYTGNISIPDSIRIYGGFDSAGQRDAAARTTTIAGNIDINSSAQLSDLNRLAELNGFYVNNSIITLKGGATYLSNVSGRGTIDNLGSTRYDYYVSVTSGRRDYAYPGDPPPASPSGPTLSVSTLIVSNLNRPRETVMTESNNSSGKDNLNKNISDYTLAYETSAAFSPKGFDENKLSDVVKGILEKNNKVPSINENGGVPIVMSDKEGKIVALPVERLQDRGYMENVSKLIDIFNNPTDDQKVVIDVAAGLVKEIEDVIGKDANSNPELKKATDELLQAVANILLAQAIPDLLKEGDLSSIKGIFSNLDTAKTKIMLEYNEATKPYYDEVKKMIEKNSEALYASNILQKNPLQKELEKLPPSQIDRIIAKLKAKEKRTTEEEYILQQEAKYREQYVEPNKKKLEENMKNMLQDFTKKLSMTLETTKK